MISLAKFTGKNKYTGLLIKETEKGSTYYMKYRDENNKVVKKAIKGIPNITHEKALKAFNKVKLEISDIKENKPIQRKRVSELTTFNEMAQYYFETHEFKSKKNEMQRFSKHCQEEEFNTKLFALITFDELDEWVNKLKKKRPSNINDPKSKKILSAKSISNILTLCISIVKYSKQNRKYNGDILFDQIKKPKIDNVTLKQMTEEEIELFFEKLQEEDIKQKGSYTIGYLYGLLALTTGAREQTILNIKKEDINFNKKIIHLYNFKTDTKYLGHIVNQEIESIIERIISINKQSDYLFYNYQTQKIYKKAPLIVRKTLDNHINYNRDEDSIITVRDLRNVFATRLINKGMSLSHIQNLLSHKTPTMTTRYAQMLDTTGGDELKELFSGVKL